MKKIVSKIYWLLVAGYCSLATLFAFPALADSPTPSAAPTFIDSIKNNFKELSTTVYDRELAVTINSPAIIVATFMRWFFAGIGIAFLILTLYAGNKWMGAAGNEESVDIARKTLVRATVGALISLIGFVLITALQFFIENAGLS